MTIILLFLLAGIALISSNYNKLYLLFIPLILIYKRCIFVPFEFEIFGMNLYQDLVVLSILLISYYINNETHYKNLFKIKSFENVIIKVFVIYLIFILILSVIMGGGIFKSITLSRYLFYIPLLYNAYLRICQGVSKQDFERFVDKVIVLNTIFAIFYILDSSGIYTIYAGVKYISAATEFGVITRNYDTFPPLT